MNRSNSYCNGQSMANGNSAYNGNPAARIGYLGDERLNGPWHWWYMV